MKSYISNYNLESKKINNLKIVHISDIHFHKTFNLKKLETLKNEINKLNPNYICITGDLIDEPKVFDDEFYYQLFMKFLKELGNICKVIITLGNHEMRSKGFKKIEYDTLVTKFSNINNVIILNNQIYIDNNIRFIGYNPTYEYYDKKGRNINLLITDFNKQNFKINDKNYNILLIHTPKDLFEDKLYKKMTNFNKLDLILSGHTHGGLMPNGFFGHFGLISPGKRFFPKNVRGILKKENTTLIISLGVTRLSHSAHLFRYFNSIYKMSINNIIINKASNKLHE